MPASLRAIDALKMIVYHGYRRIALSMYGNSTTNSKQNCNPEVQVHELSDLSTTPYLLPRCLTDSAFVVPKIRKDDYLK